MLDIKKSIEELTKLLPNDVIQKGEIDEMDDNDLALIIMSIQDLQKNNITAFPSDKQQASEIKNRTEEVDANEELKKKNPVQSNKEAMFEKAIKYDSVYDLIDNTFISKSSIIEGAQPSGAKTLGTQIERELYYSLRNSIDDWFSKINSDTDVNKAIIDLRKQMINWTQDAQWAQMNNMKDLFFKGLEVGENLAGVETDFTAWSDVNNQIFKQSGISNAIEKLSNDVFNNSSDILKQHYNKDKGIPLYRTKRHLDSYLKKSRARTELMLKTETAKFANMGLLKAYEIDPSKYKYNYYWVVKSDDRTKKISEIRKSGNPYSYDEINFLWKHQEQMINGKWQADQFNQRCSIARGEELDSEFNTNRFLGKEYLFRETM